MDGLSVDGLIVWVASVWIGLSVDGLIVWGRCGLTSRRTHRLVSKRTFSINPSELARTGREGTPQTVQCVPMLPIRKGQYAAVFNPSGRLFMQLSADATSGTREWFYATLEVGVPLDASPLSGCRRRILREESWAAKCFSRLSECQSVGGIRLRLCGLGMQAILPTGCTGGIQPPSSVLSAIARSLERKRLSGRSFTAQQVVPAGGTQVSGVCGRGVQLLYVPHVRALPRVLCRIHRCCCC